MKIQLEKYPLADQTRRNIALTNQSVRDALLKRAKTSNYTDDAELMPYYEQFLDDLAVEKELKTYLFAETMSAYLFDHSEKIMTKLWPFISEIPDSTGLILWRNWSCFYRKFERNGETVIIHMTTDTNQADVGAIIKDKALSALGQLLDLPSKKTVMRGTPIGNNQPLAVAHAMLTLFLPFIHFAECETKIVNATHNHKAKLNNEKYVTNIKHNIEIVDSNWFTTLIRTDAFGVSGHFRLQPVGEGRTGRKLIWIKDYEKHGYTKRAKIEIDKDL